MKEIIPDKEQTRKIFNAFLFAMSDSTTPLVAGFCANNIHPKWVLTILAEAFCSMAASTVEATYIRDGMQIDVQKLFQTLNKEILDSMVELSKQIDRRDNPEKYN